MSDSRKAKRRYERGAIARLKIRELMPHASSLGLARLDRNENPYPPSPAVMNALRSIDADSLRRYPEPTAAHVRELIATLHGVSPENVVATNGGDEFLRLAITTFVPPGGTMGLTNPTYSAYPKAATIQEARTVSVDLDNGWKLPDNAAQVWNRSGAHAVFIVNPESPSGQLIHASQIKKLAYDLNGILFIDEAYVDFVDPALEHNCVKLVSELPNVLILRTLSKGYALAGIRFGYGIGSKELIPSMLYKSRDRYNTDAVSQILAAAALGDREYAKGTWEAIRSERQRLVTELRRRGYGVENSQANFILWATSPHNTKNAKGIGETRNSS